MHSNPIAKCIWLTHTGFAFLVFVWDRCGNIVKDWKEIKQMGRKENCLRTNSTQDRGKPKSILKLKLCIEYLCLLSSFLICFSWWIKVNNEVLCYIYIILFHVVQTWKRANRKNKRKKSHSGKVGAFENSLFSAKLLIHICKKIKASLWGWP